MAEVAAAALTANLPVFNFYDISQISTWLIDTYAKPLYSVVIQSGGESRRMAPIEGACALPRQTAHRAHDRQTCTFSE